MSSTVLIVDLLHVGVVDMKNTDIFLVDEDDAAALSAAKKLARECKSGAIIRLTNAEMRSFNEGSVKVIDYAPALKDNK